MPEILRIGRDAAIAVEMLSHRCLIIYVTLIEKGNNGHHTQGYRKENAQLQWQFSRNKETLLSSFSHWLIVETSRSINTSRVKVFIQNLDMEMQR